MTGIRYRSAALAALALTSLGTGCATQYVRPNPTASKPPASTIPQGSDLWHACQDALSRPPVGPAEDDAFVVWLDASGHITGIRPLHDDRSGEHPNTCAGVTLPGTR